MRGTGTRAVARPGGRPPWRFAGFLALLVLLSTLASLAGRELALRGGDEGGPRVEQSVREVSITAPSASARPYELVGARHAEGPVAGFVDGPPNAVRRLSPSGLRSALAAGPGEVGRVRRGTPARRRSTARQGGVPGYQAQVEEPGTASVAQAASAAVAKGRHLVVQVRPGRSVALHARPGGRRVASAGPRTEFGSPRAMGVVRRRGRWLGVIATGQPNGRVVWVDGVSSSLNLATTRISLAVDRSRRTLVVRRGARVILRTRVAVGAVGTSTPTGRFTVTDRLAGGRFSSFYGCCILALSGVQPYLPPGWQGGNRLAIHGTNRPATVGRAVTAGCLRAAHADLRALMAVVPLGTRVTVRP